MRQFIFLTLGASAFVSAVPGPVKPALGDRRGKAAVPPPPPGQNGTPPERGKGTGVTERIVPSAAPPPECNLNYAGEFGIAVMKPNIQMTNDATKAKAELAKAAAAQSSSGGASGAGLPMFPGLGALGGMVQMPPKIAIARKAVAQKAMAQKAATPSPADAEVTPPPDLTAAAPPVDPVSQAPLTTNITQQTTQTLTKTVTVRKTVMNLKPQVAVGNVNAYPVYQIGDGQIQAPRNPTNLSITTLITPTPVLPPATPVAGQPALAPETPQVTLAPVTQIGDGQIQAPGPVATPSALNVANALEAPDTPNAPPIALDSLSAASGQDAAIAVPAPAAPDAARKMKERRQLVPSAPASGPAVQLVSCKTPGTLRMTLNDGVLLDSQKRTGYIASNYQFQFDGPPQSGSIYTAGFSVCNNGSLALGGSTTWYQCLSGDFYNLYDRWWAAQCQPVTINAVILKDC